MALRPRRPGPAETDDARIVVVAQLESNLEELRRQGRDDGVAPLDERDAFVVEQLAETEVEKLLQVLEPVRIDMHDREGAVLRGDGQQLRGSLPLLPQRRTTAWVAARISS